MKLIIITDTHANLPALQAVLGVAEREGYDEIIHTGDALCIGPQPAECLDLLLGTPRLTCLMGNHDYYFAHGIPNPPPAWMSLPELQHKQWTYAQLDPTLRQQVAMWEWMAHRDVGGQRLALLHYALGRNGTGFRRIIHQATADQLDRLFEDVEGQVIFYGHHHPPDDQRGRARYINPGSLGCHRYATARFAVAESVGNQCRITMREVGYDDRPLFQAFRERSIPEAAFMQKVFFGGRDRTAG